MYSLTVPLYEYRCACGTWTDREHGLERFTCAGCGGRITRRYSFTIGVRFDGGYMPSTGGAVTSRADLQSELSRLSDNASEQTGITHNFQSHDLRDRDFYGVTDEGLSSTYDAHPDNHPVREAIRTIK